jgi:hypothetical protein
VTKKANDGPVGLELVRKAVHLSCSQEPLSALEHVRDLRADLDASEAELVKLALEEGDPWAEIVSAVGKPMAEIAVEEGTAGEAESSPQTTSPPRYRHLRALD